MVAKAKAGFHVTKEAISAWAADKAPRLGAALSYYTIFAMPPLFIIVLFVASLVFDPDQVRSALFSQVGGLVGEKGAETIQSAMTAQQQNNTGTISGIIAVLTLVFTATGLFIELQGALNSIFKVETKPGRGFKEFIRDRVLSLAMVIVIGFLLLVSLVLSAGVSAFTKYVSGILPALSVLSSAADIALSFAVITVLFAVMFRFLPDVRIGWRAVWVGAVATSILFTVGKFLLGMYLGKNTTVSAYGAAGSIILILLWVYYSAQILFFGAEVSKVYAERFGIVMEPKPAAQWTAAARQAPDGRPFDRRTAQSVELVQSTPEKLLTDLRHEVAYLRSIVDRNTARTEREKAAVQSDEHSFSG